MPRPISIFHRLVALTLAVLLLLPVVLPTIWGSWYTWANESFSRNFCVNFEEPATMCNGQCQMGEFVADWSREPTSQQTLMPTCERSLTYVSEPTPVLKISAQPALFYQPLRIRKMGEKRGGYQAAIFRPPPPRHFV